MYNNNDDKMHPQDIKNLITFIVIALGVWYCFDYFVFQPRSEALQQSIAAQEEMARGPDAPGGAGKTLRPREEVISETPRIKIQNENITGSLSLVGGRIDDIVLDNYYKTIKKRHKMEMFSPSGSLHARYATFGWVASDENMPLPDKNVRWRIAGQSENDAPPVLKPGAPVTIYWENGQGLRFERQISVDDQYMFTVTQRVINQGQGSVTLYPYTLITQHGLPEDLYGRWIIHEGPIGYMNEELVELSYSKISKKETEKKITADNGWIALTEHYWFSGILPENRVDNEFRFIYVKPKTRGVQERYQVDMMGPGETLTGSGQYESTSHVYVGPKKLDILENYEAQYDVPHMDLALDFGMYYFLTKPLFYILHWLGDKAGDFGFTGNFGIGIILLTFIVRIFVFPLANTSYRSFAGLKKVAPQMHALREKHGDDKQKLQQEMVKLYEKENVNPMAGCLPILIQIPIFFALFKVLQISIEMRHAPFYGWIQDLSAPDPTSIFNLFGLLPYNVPQFLMIGAWPCMMMVFLILQKKMNPPPQDKMQKAMMDAFPFIITLILSKFAAGLVIYWTFSNALSVVQQYIIMKSMGVEPELFKSKAQKEEERKMREADVHPGMEMIEDEVEEALFGDENEQIAAEEEKPVSKPKPKKSKKKK